MNRTNYNVMSFKDSNARQRQRNSIRRTDEEREELLDLFNATHLDRDEFNAEHGLTDNFLYHHVTMKRKEYNVNPHIILAMQWIYGVKNITPAKLMRDSASTWNRCDSHEVLAAILTTSNFNVAKGKLDTWFKNNPDQDHDTYKRLLK